MITGSDLLDSFFVEEKIGGTTINTVTSPMVGDVSFASFLLVAAIVVSVVVFILGKKYTSDSFAKIISIVFICAAFIFMLRMDTNWLRVLGSHMSHFPDMDVSERIAYLEGSDFYDFISFVKLKIPEKEKVRQLESSSSDYYVSKGRYYLLPVETSAKGEYVWTFNADARYDPSSGTLTIGNFRMPHVKRTAIFRPGAELYRIGSK